MFRGDIVIGLVVVVLNVLTWWIAGVIWSFFYNKHFTHRLVEKGYVFTGTDAEIAAAKSALGIIN